MKNITIFLFTALIILTSFSVSFSQHNKHKCGTQIEHERLIKEQPGYLESFNETQAYVKKFLKDHPNGYSPKATITVPVVFHVILNATQMQSMPDSRIQEQLTTLNKDFGGQSTHPMGSFPASLKANTEIQFCLATLDTLGNAFSGIERKTSDHGAWGMSSDVKFNSKGGLNQWDPNKYLNIWVCEVGGSTLGYGNYANSQLAPLWGLVIHWENVGLTGSPAPYNLGATATHEIGHCFTLAHIWGDASGCTQDDGYNDTPKQDVETYGTNTGVLTDACTSTSPGIMYMNYMDYSDDGAMSCFTPDQKTVMQALFAPGGVLYNLGQSTACGPPPSPVEALFTGNPITILAGGTVSFTDASTGTPTSWSWNFGDPNSGASNTSTLQNPTHTFTTPGMYTITLTVTNAVSTDTETKTNYITVNTSNPNKPVANFAADYTTVIKNGTTNFTDLSLYTPSTWKWRIQTGSNTYVTSTVQNPSSIQYPNKGSFKVTLTVSNINGSDSMTKTNYIKVIDSTQIGTSKPKVDFRASKRLISMGTSINFRDSSSFNPTSWKWYFQGANPSTSTMQNPTGINYPNAGTFYVALVASNPNGSDSLKKTGYIKVTSTNVWFYCGDTTKNVPKHEPKYRIRLSDSWGYIPGNNGVGVKAYADRYEYYGFSHIKSLIVPVEISKPAVSSTSAVNFKVWKGTSLPTGNPIATKSVLLRNLSAGLYHDVPFNAYVPVDGVFFVGYDVTYGTPQDTFVTSMAVNRGINGTSTLCVQQANSVWANIKDVPELHNITTSLAIKVTGCLLTGEETEQYIIAENMLIYPNPTNNVVNIEIMGDDGSEKITITAFDIIGKEISNSAEQIYNGHYIVDLSNQKTGIYFIKITKGNKTQIKKVSLVK